MEDGNIDKEIQEGAKQILDDLKSPIIPNTIAFNGIIKSEPVSLGNDYYAVDILAGPEKEEFPSIILKAKDMSLLKINERLVGMGVLKKQQGLWIVLAKTIVNI